MMLMIPFYNEKKKKTNLVYSLILNPQILYILIYSEIFSLSISFPLLERFTEGIIDSMRSNWYKEAIVISRIIITRIDYTKYVLPGIICLYKRKQFSWSNNLLNILIKDFFK